jgi:GT2 family glycosyltransferase
MEWLWKPCNGVIGRLAVDLSIIVVNWNAKNLLLPCLDSIYQTCKGVAMEVFVIDNGSTDGSGEAVKERFPKVTFIQNQKNVGFAMANNQALRLSKGNYLLLLNPDTKMKEGAIERLVSFMESSPEAGVVGAQLLNDDGSKQNSIANFPSLATELLNKSLLRWLFPKQFPGKERDYSNPVEVDSVIGACMMVRREAMDQVGLLDEEYFLFLEETDWCYRIKKAGWKVYHIPQAEIYHFQGKSAELEKKKAKIEYYRSRYHFFKKNRGTLQWVILHIGLIVRLGVELILTATVSFFTFFTVKRWRERLLIYAYLMGWHLRLCPEGMGLKPLTLPLSSGGRGKE